MNFNSHDMRRAFWHRSRKEFVPLTGEEFGRRLRLEKGEAFTMLGQMEKNNLVTNTKAAGCRVRVYELSEFGRRFMAATA